jgi:AcrR family transcriptional regulator
VTAVKAGIEPSERPDSGGLTASGIVPGRKGRRTRERLLAEVERRCLLVSHRTITVAQIAQAAGTSSATFYHYFPDIATAAAEAASAQLKQFDAVIASATEVVQSDASESACRAFVEAFFQYWDTRPGLLQAVATTPVEESPAFLRVLSDALAKLAKALAPAAGTGRQGMAVAGSLILMMSSGTARRIQFEGGGVSLETLIDAQAHVVHRVLHQGCTST